jgi:hypothetical protein
MNQFSQLSKFYILIILLCGVSSNVSGQQSWVNLFENGNLDGFEKLNGKADFLFKDGILTGISTMNTPNTFLATKKKYGDFILEFEVLIENGLNSGVQFRSLSKPEYRNNRVHGYQCELETSPRKWAGGIYDEARRGWLYPLSVNKKGQWAFKTGSWNKVRIQAIGNHINTWVNGIHCARLVDDMTSEGFIAFQVHGIGNKKALEGKKVHWKDVKICTENLESEKWIEAPYANEISYLKNQLTDTEKRKGWRLLWDGTSTEGWVGAKILNDFPSKGWVIEDGNLIVLPSDGGESTNGGDIITKKKYSNFELELEFMLTEGGNSGIKYFVDPFLNKGPGSAIGLEFQILDDKKHPDAKKGVNGNRTIGSLYDLIPAGNLSESNRETKRVNGIGSWNKARIISKNGHVEHWLNNVKVVEFDRYSQIFHALVDNSKYVDWPNFGQLSEGNILLQDHGDRVAFRSIKIREF